MKKLVYIGNFLNKDQTYQSASDLLVDSLCTRDYPIEKSSNKRNKAIRIIEITVAIFNNRNTTKVLLIDVFSTLNFYQALWAKGLAKWLKIPHVLILHGGNLPHRIKQNQLLSKYLFKNASAIVAPSFYLKEAVEKEGYKVVYIPNMLNIINYPLKMRSVLKPHLLWVRAFDKIYNPQMAIEVLIELLKTYPEARLTMVGPDKDGSLLACKKLVNKYSLNDSVRFTGALTKADWHLVAQQHDIFINTTTVDNTPVSVMEAMALGLPVVSTEVGGIPFLLEDGVNALLCESANAVSMANQINKLLEDPILVHDLSANARKKVEQFDIELVQKKWIELINNV